MSVAIAMQIVHKIVEKIYQIKVVITLEVNWSDLTSGKEVGCADA